MTSFLGIRKGIIMPVDERNLEVIVNDLIKDVNTHAQPDSCYSNRLS
ncbi:hypothetical protein EFP10_101 [Enterococcus phage EF-P10]|nr:hypothetical protein EFP10_101 [Enterococcus phage EF-P10]